MVVQLSASEPFEYFVYPIVEGQRGDPISSGDSSPTGNGGTSPPTQNAGPIVTPPLDDLPDAPEDDIQAEIRRLADVTKQSQDAMRAGQNITNTELDKLNDQTAEMKALMGQVASISAQANQHLSQIEANGGGTGTGTGGLTQGQLQETLENAAGNGPEPAEVAEAQGFTDNISQQFTDTKAAVQQIGGSMEDMLDALGLDREYTQDSWNFDITLGQFGSFTVDFSSYTWAFDLVRQVTLGMLCMHYVGKLFRAMRGAFI